MCTSRAHDLYTLHAGTYGTAHFKLEKACVWHLLDTTRFSFRMRAGMRELARSMT